MHVRADDDDWTVSAGPGATVRDLLRALDLDAEGGATIDGAWHPGSAPLTATGLRAGSAVHPGSVAPPPRPATAELVVRLGPDAGRRIPVPSEVTIGRTDGEVRLADPSVSARHARLGVADPERPIVDDLGSTNGTSAHGRRIRLGCTELEVGAPTAAAARRGGGPHHRPPRPTSPPPPAGVEPPIAPAAPERPRLAVATMAVPLATGLVLAGLYGPQMAIVAVIGPIVALGGWLAARTSAGRAARRQGREHAHALEAFVDAVRAAVDHEQQRRRESFADLVTTVDRAQRGDVRLWERRAGDDDFLQLPVGRGDAAWEPPLTRTPGADAEAAIVATGARTLRDVPITVDAGELLGVCGPRPFAVALARALTLHAAVHHGPADVRIAVVASPANGPDWRWTRWLPHTVDPRDPHRRLLAHDHATSADLVASCTDATAWFVVDGEDDQLARHGALRAHLVGEARGLVVARHRDGLPAACATVIEVDHTGAVTVHRRDAARPQPACLAGLGVETAEAAARALAPLVDPELADQQAALSDSCDLLDALGAGDGAQPITATGVRDRWSRTAGTDELVVPLGVDEHGTFDLDLVRDGPHALVAGTTGAGKSELLRSLVASLAASADVEHCNLVLVDFKGGAAFDRLVALPHVVGCVTDLDEHLAARALRCLEAELRRRERVLRDVGASDITGYTRLRRCDGELEPLPRLVVVIDEFATLVAELPDFVDALVDMAQRGRSLGVHLVLATQRPAGAVKDSIRTNTNLRIALRMVDTADSRDVIGTDDAARLSAQRPGRAILRRGSAEPVTIQAAHVSGRRARAVRPRVEAARWDPIAPSARVTPAADDRVPSDLDRLVDAVQRAHATAGFAEARRPWPDPLPASTVFATHHVFALADRPEEQRVEPMAWTPDANLLVAGTPGSGVTSTLRTLAIACATARPVEALHLYAVTADVEALGCVDDLPHCGSVVAIDDVERTVRLLHHLDAEMRRRRHARGAHDPVVVTLVDGVAALRAELDTAGLLDELDLIDRLVAEGPSVGMVFVLGAEHPSAIGHRLDRTTGQRLLLRLPERNDYLVVGVGGVDPHAMPPGRGYLADGTEVQVARTDAEDVARVSAGAAIGRARPTSIERLPAQVSIDAVGARASHDDGVLHVTFGIGGRGSDAVGVRWHPGDHVLVTGPSRSGKSQSLATIAHLVGRDTDVQVADLATDRRRADRPDAASLREVVGALLSSDEPTLVLVDDADLLDDEGALLPLVQPGRPSLHVIAAGRGDRLRGLFRHWTNEVRRSRVGLLLRGDELDGDLLGARVPRSSTAPWVAGRGWLVSDDGVELCQVAAIDEAAAPDAVAR